MTGHLPLRPVPHPPARGGALRALAMVMGGWIAMRLVFVIGDDGTVHLRVPEASDFAARESSLTIAASKPTPTPILVGHSDQWTAAAAPARPSPMPFFSAFGDPPHLASAPFAAPMPPIYDTPRAPVDVAAVDRDYMGQLGPLFLSGQSPVPFRHPANFAAPERTARPIAGFSLYAYIFVRPDAASGAPYSTYGGSQMFARADWRLGASGVAGRSSLYARASRDLTRDGRGEMATGVTVRPLSRVPIIVHGERRFRAHAPDANAVFITAQGAMPLPLPIPLNLNADWDVQAGRVWPDKGAASDFYDGQARLTTPIQRADRWSADAGVMLSTGGQRTTDGAGAGRLDIGPVATLGTHDDRASVRGAVGWRFRIAGEAKPASGPAVMVSVGF